MQFLAPDIALSDNLSASSAAFQPRPPPFSLVIEFLITRDDTKRGSLSSILIGKNHNLYYG